MIGNSRLHKMPSPRQASPANARPSALIQRLRSESSQWPGQHAQQRRGHRGDRREQPLIVAEAVVALVDLAREIMPVEIAGQVGLDR